MEHIVLMGDSVFDNKSYVSTEPSVIEHLREIIPADWSATLCAVDGDTTLEIHNQIPNVSKSATCLFVSVGGNDAITSICELKKPTCLCTIYNGNLEPIIASAVKAEVSVFNDKIYSVANERHLDVIDLRRICDKPDDYANPIEPSGRGGDKIAKAIHEHVIRGKYH